LRGGPGHMFDIFIEALREYGYGHVADDVINTDICEDDIADSAKDFDLTDDKLLRLVTETDASRISYCIGNGWENLFYRLGLSKVQIEREASQRNDTSLTVTNLLIRWKNKEGRSATWKQLLIVILDLEKTSVDMLKLRNLAHTIS